MREIKFRAWCNIKKFMIKHIWEMSLEYEGSEPFVIGDDSRSNNFELMQYTGLKDKNGKEIYEGDIVDFVYCKKRYVDVVVYERNNFCCENTFAPFESHLEDCEVIGNIYENPELLKGD